MVTDYDDDDDTQTRAARRGEGIRMMATLTREGLDVTVYRNAEGWDGTNGGITARKSRLVLVGTTEAPVQGFPVVDTPAEMEVVRRGAVVARGDQVVLRRGYLPGTWIAVPRVWVEDGLPPGTVGPMFGGNFVYSSDSRFREAGCTGPIAVHDRIEANDARGD